MRLLVTGATGFVGSHLCERLLSDKHEVWGLSRSAKTTNVTRLQSHSNFHLPKCDIIDFDAILTIFRSNKFDIIFHVAAHLPAPLPDDPIPYLETNAKGTLNILRAAHLTGVKKIIYSSSMTVYGAIKSLPVDESHPVEPVNLYGLTKLMGEMTCQLYARTYGFQVIILRYSGIFGPGKEWGAVANFIDKALKNKPPVIFSDGSDIWDTVYVKDAIAANILALANIDRFGMEIFNVGLGKGMNITDVANRILELTGSTVKPQFGSAPSGQTFIYDLSKANNMLGFTPTPFDEALKEYVNWKKRQSPEIRI